MKILKPAGFLIVTLLFGNVLIWLEEVLYELRSPYTNGYTVAYTTVIIGYGLVLELLRGNRKEIRIHKEMLGISVFLLIVQYLPLLKLYDLATIPFIKYAIIPMTHGAGRAIVGVATGMLLAYSLFRSKSSAL